MSNEVRKHIIVNEYTLCIPKHISEEVANGTIECNLRLTSGGLDVWYRFTDIQRSHVSYDGNGIMEALAKIDNGAVVNSVSSTLKGKGRSLQVSSSSESEEQNYTTVVPVRNKRNSRIPETYSESLTLVRGRKLENFRIIGVLNKLPSNSLAAREFKRPIEDLVARAFLVAHKRGHTKLWGIIGNQVDSHKSATLKEWWDVATPVERAMVLSSGKHLDVESIPIGDMEKLNSMVYPF